MSKNVTTRKLPHGTIPFAQIKDPQTRAALMKINENMRALDGRLKSAESAVRELQGRA